MLLVAYDSSFDVMYIGIQIARFTIISTADRTIRIETIDAFALAFPIISTTFLLFNVMRQVKLRKRKDLKGDLRKSSALRLPRPMSNKSSKALILATKAQEYVREARSIIHVANVST